MVTRRRIKQFAVFAGLFIALFIHKAAANQRNSLFSNVTIGLGATYNLNTKAKGVLGRIDTEVFPRTKLIAEYTYFPKYVSTIPEYESVGISEYYIQGFLAFNIIEYKGFKTFIGAGGSASKWINNNEFSRAASRTTNLSGDALLGVQQQIKKINLFSEFRYNLFWGEYHIQAGIGIFLYQKNKSSKKSLADAVACPKFNF
ncbi:MAG: hypothetical protein J0M08_07195 [Bacteroidetes bacterium]|nr:hypothetical protein [Bacteroidota bacterium]